MLDHLNETYDLAAVVKVNINVKGASWIGTVEKIFPSLSMPLINITCINTS